MDKLKIALIQADLIWEKPKDNYSKFNRLLKQIENADLVILPEMFTTGFTMNAKAFAEEINGNTANWLKETALQNNFAIMGSCIINEGEDIFNRLLMTYPCTSISWYNKRHLFRMGNEHEQYSAGQKSKVFNYLGWRIQPQVCYDLRFPVWSRNQNHYDLLVYVANWPKSRREAWLTLLKARAIENQCYVIGVNRVGQDGNGVDYSGDSVVINAKGDVILALDPEKETIGTIEISLKELNDFKEKFPAYLDADQFDIKI